MLSVALSRRRALSAALLSVAPLYVDKPAAGAFTFFGAANPPATYGGVGGTTPTLARYSFDLPDGSFREDSVSKVEKGMTGLDCHFSSVPARKKEEVFVISLRNEGSRGVRCAATSEWERGLKSLRSLSYSRLTHALTVRRIQLIS